MTEDSSATLTDWEKAVLGNESLVAALNHASEQVRNGQVRLRTREGQDQRTQPAWP